MHLASARINIMMSRSERPEIMEIITAVRGFKDILPAEAGKWQQIEKDSARSPC